MNAGFGCVYLHHKRPTMLSVAWYCCPHGQLFLFSADMTTEKQRVSFYFDGFNFYNGLKDKCRKSPEWRDFYWIDFVKLCQAFLPQDQVLQKVKYFTAPPLNSGKRSRQATLFAANKLLNPGVFEIIQGKYYKKNVTCKLCGGVFQQPEEKRTDVNISLELMLDCFNDNTDKLVLVTADSDLISTVQAVKKYFPQKTLKIYFPPLRSSGELLKACGKVVYFENNKSKFETAVMPDTVTVGPKSYIKPTEWNRVT